MKAFNLLIALGMFSLLQFALSEAVVAQSQTKESMPVIRKSEVGFLCWLPSDYKKSRKEKFPLIIFLHGSGERGRDLDKVKIWGPPSFVESQPDFPFIVVSPQCPDGRWWDISELDAMLSRILKKYKVDPNRVYLTGLSMGGFATWSWAIEHPERFAAIAPVCGGGEKLLAENLKKLPIWAFHGEDDPVVPVKSTIDMVNAVNESGGHALLTIYPGVGHDSWRNAYSNEELYKWFLAQKRQNK